jgi:hypothetical protein
MPEDTREYFWNDWNMILIDNDLVTLEKWHSKGLLTAEQEGSYARLKAKLREALPMLERLDIQPPREILGDG